MTATIETPASGAASSGATFESLNPANGDVVGVHPICSKADVDAAVQRAREGADWWGALSFERARRIPPCLAQCDYASHRPARGVGAPGDRQAHR